VFARFNTNSPDASVNTVATFALAGVTAELAKLPDHVVVAVKA
jgi:hypothetical protein